MSKSIATAYISFSDNLGSVRGCSRLGEMYYIGKEVAQDKNKAIELYTKGCDRGDAIACIELGNIFDKGVDVKKDIIKAKAFFHKACNGNGWYGGYMSYYHLD